MIRNSKILIILTGGTISMVQDASRGLVPASREVFESFVPELFHNNDILVDIHTFEPLIDSSDVSPQMWVKLAHTIYENYNVYDGFVVLHGTDTMAYSASALSFMFLHLSKCVVFTGSQLPIGVLRSDARENLLSAIEVASAKNSFGNSMVPEVCVYFSGLLFRGNRTTKQNSEQFEAFASFNFPPLATVGVHIHFAEERILPSDDVKLKLLPSFNTNVALIKLFPGITEHVLRGVLSTDGLRGVVLETYGSGNAPSADWLYELLCEATQRGVIIINKTQCSTGNVNMGYYAVSQNLLRAGVLSGYDITTEALLTKMMVLFGNYDNTETIKHQLGMALVGEMTVDK